MTIDWDSAPEGTTHRNQFNGVWIKLLNQGGGQYQAWINGCWEMGFGHMNNAYQQRPPQAVTEWNGKGLPPVGTVCVLSGPTPHLNTLHPEWEGAEVKIYAHFNTDQDRALAAYVSADHMKGGVGIAELFLPIRTAEQIKAENEISEMIDDAMDGHMCLTEAEAKIVCSQLHKAGYRKQVAQ
ncbi:hypothetical protein N015_13120 [Pseudomonas asturiensis]|uniref:Uncharacterized protein n=1 Tax=Pseudomonas asturiensis TaxID=1190415 RepID=A0ABX6HCJ6_9PSED|nr:hypothetical protein [Pseudomonas asturiensis]QHF03295.1 hypothetical protein N015_13120 [Pseudomonas asturiensis]